MNILKKDTNNNEKHIYANNVHYYKLWFTVNLMIFPSYLKPLCMYNVWFSMKTLQRKAIVFFQVGRFTIAT